MRNLNPNYFALRWLLRTWLAVFSLLLSANGFAQFSTQSQRLSSSYGDFKFHLLGENNQTSILIIGGGPGFSSWNLEPIQYQLAKHNYRVLIADPFGIGENAQIKPDSWLTAWIEQLKQLSSYQNQSKVILIGHSWGALMAMLFSQNYPDKVAQLVLVNPVDPEKKSIKRLAEQLDYKKRQLENFDQFEDQDWDNAISLKTIDETALAQKQIKQILPLYFVDHAAGKRYSRQFSAVDFNVSVNIEVWKEYDQKPLSYQNLRQLNLPIKIIGCHEDVLMPFNLSALRANLQVTSLTILNHCNHFPWVEQSESFNRALIGALED